MRPIVALGLLVAACSGGAAETTTTAVAPPTTAAPVSTSTTEATMTTASTLVPKVVPLVPFDTFTSPLTMRPNQTYFHDIGPVPLEFRFSEEGWSAVFVGERAFSFVNETSDLPVEVFLSFMPLDTVDETVIDLVEDEKAGEATEAMPFTVAGASGLVFDLVIPPPASQSLLPGAPACVGPLLVEEPYPSGGSWFQDLVGCAANRVWVGDVSGVTVVVHGAIGTREPDDVKAVEMAVPLFDEFLAAITFSP